MFTLFEWSLPDEFDAEDAALRLPDSVNVWTDGCLVWEKVSGASSSGFGFYALLLGQAWEHRRWGHLDDDRSAGRMINSCRGFCSVPGPLQNFQRAELWIHLDVDKMLCVKLVDCWIV